MSSFRCEQVWKTSGCSDMVSAPDWQCLEHSAAIGRSQLITKDHNVLLSMTRSEDVAVRWSVASSVFAPPAVLALLIHDSQACVRYAVATNQKSPDFLLECLIGDFEDLACCLAVASNPVIGMEIQNLLAHHPAWQVRRTIAESQRVLADSVQLILAQDPKLDVRYMLASRSDTTPEVKHLLNQDPDPTINELVNSRS